MLFVLFRGRGLCSALIRWQTRSCYSHAALVVSVRPLRIIEAWHKGVHEKNLTDISNVDFFEVGAPVDEAKAIGFARAQLGCRYDYSGVIRFLTKVRAKRNEKWFCSEIVAEALKAGGVALLRKSSAFIAPEHLSWSTSARRLDESSVRRLLAPPNQHL